MNCFITDARNTSCTKDVRVSVGTILIFSIVFVILSFNAFSVELHSLIHYIVILLKIIATFPALQFSLRGLILTIPFFTDEC